MHTSFASFAIVGDIKNRENIIPVNEKIVFDVNILTKPIFLIQSI